MDWAFSIIWHETLLISSWKVVNNWTQADQQILNIISNFSLDMKKLYDIDLKIIRILKASCKKLCFNYFVIVIFVWYIALACLSVLTDLFSFLCSEWLWCLIDESICCLEEEERWRLFFRFCSGCCCSSSYNSLVEVLVKELVKAKRARAS